LLGFAFSPDSKLLAVETGYGVIRLLEPDTGREWARLEDPNRHRAATITFSPDGTQLVAVSGDSGEALHIWDLRAIGQRLAELGFSWDLPLDLPANPNPSPDPLRIQVELSAELYVIRAQSHRRLKQFDQAIADYQKALAQDPKQAPVCNDLAWLYVTGPPEVRDAAKALSLAQEAVESKWKPELCLNTMGVVHYRLGQWEKAVATLQDADKADKNQECRAWNGYFLAMSYHQLGDTAKAQKAYQEAVEWQTQAKRRPHEIEELNAFRAEAEALLKKHVKP
jgi:tetratricopeptide (TPR) repeat protein